MNHDKQSSCNQLSLPGSQGLRPIRDLARQEDGMLSMSAVPVMLALAFASALLLNVIANHVRRAHLQNAADSASLSIATLRARSMNAVTAANHLAGEAIAVASLIDALGTHRVSDGKEYETKTYFELGVNDALIVAARNLQLTLLSNMDKSKENPGIGGSKFGAMLFDCDVTNRRYAGLGSALWIAGQIPILAFLRIPAVAIAISCAKEDVIIKVLAKVSGVMHAGPLTPHVIVKDIVPVLHFSYQQAAASPVTLGIAFKTTLEELETKWNVDLHLDVGTYASGVIGPKLLTLDDPPRTGASEPRKVTAKVSSIPDVMGETLDGAIKFIDNILSLADKVSKLPFVDDLLPDGAQSALDKAKAAIEAMKKGLGENPSYADMRDLNLDLKSYDRSQLVRAAYPYTDEYRYDFASALNSLAGLPVSQGSQHFVNWSSYFTVANAAKAGQNCRVHIVEGSDKTSKKLNWEDDSKAVERKLTLAILSQTKSPRFMGAKLFGPSSLETSVSFSQAILYNANGNQSGSGKYQPKTGWDTLNWDPGYNAHEYPNVTMPSKNVFNFSIAKMFDLKNSSHRPKVKLNWQPKLVPISREKLLLLLPVAEGDARELVTQAAAFQSVLIQH